ncbi:MAG: hypothetical protein ABIQ60_13550, partial [Burkholderiaceae bacterium]
MFHSISRNERRSDVTATTPARGVNHLCALRRVKREYLDACARRPPAAPAWSADRDRIDHRLHRALVLVVAEHE